MRIILRLFSVLLLANFSYAMDEVHQENNDVQDVPSGNISHYLTELLEDQFKELSQMVEKSKEYLNNPESVQSWRFTNSFLRETLYQDIHKEIATLEQCLWLDYLYKQIETKREEHDTLYKLHMKNMDSNYIRAMKIYNQGYRQEGMRWLLATMNEVEEAFIWLAEKKQDDDVLHEASEAYKAIKLLINNTDADQ